MEPTILQLIAEQGPLGILLVILYHLWAARSKAMHTEAMGRMDAAMAELKAAAGTIREAAAIIEGAKAAAAPVHPIRPLGSRQGRVFTPLLLLIAAILSAVMLLAGCGSVPAQGRADLAFGFKAWEEDKRPTLTDEEYAALSEEDRELYMPQSREYARRVFWREATKTAEHGQ